METPVRNLLIIAAISLAAARAGAEGPYSFYPVEPCRITPTLALTAGTPASLQVTGQCTVPATAKVVAVNLTVAAPAGDGFIIVWAFNATMPTVSNLNFKSTDNAVANSATVKLGTDGKISVVAGVSGVGTFIVDVQGYFL
jgi:hypothetical protein